MFFLIHNLGELTQYHPYYLPNVLLMDSVNPLASLLKAAIASIAFLCSSSSFFNSGFIFYPFYLYYTRQKRFCQLFYLKVFHNFTYFSSTKKAPGVNRGEVIHVVL